MGKKKGIKSAKGEAGDNYKNSEQPSSSKKATQSLGAQGDGGSAPPTAPQPQRIQSGRQETGQGEPSQRAPQPQKIQSKRQETGQGEPSQRAPQPQKIQSKRQETGQGEPSQRAPQPQKIQSKRQETGQGEPSQREPQPQGAWSRGFPMGQGVPPQTAQQPQGAWSAGIPVGQVVPPQIAPQPQGAWSAGIPVGQGMPPQIAPQPQGAWSRGFSVGQGVPPQIAPQPQGAWSAGIPVGQGMPPQTTSQPQGAWSRGFSVGQGVPPQIAPQPQGAWSAGIPVGQGMPPQTTSQPQGAWSRGFSVGQGVPPQTASQLQGAWSREIPVGQGGRPQTAPQPQGAWSREIPVEQGEPSQTASQQQGAWSREIPVGQGGRPQTAPQPQGAWSREIPVEQGEPSQTAPQPQGAWSREIPVEQGEPSQAASQPQGAWSRGIPVGRGERPQKASQSQRSWSSSPSSEKKDTLEKPKKKRPSPDVQVSVEFAPRIFAAKKSGREITVISNFFPLIILDPNIIIFHYDVEIEPDKPKYLLREVWKKFVSLMFPGRLTAFDGKNAYSKGPLANEKSSSATVTVFNVENNNEKDFKVTIKEVRRISFSCFQDFVQRIRQDSSMRVPFEAELSVLDIILRNEASDNFVKSGNNFFSPLSIDPRSIDLSNKLCMKSGYFQSAFLGYKLYLNFDISHKAFYKSLPVLDILDSFKVYKSQNIDKDQMTHFLRSAKVEYTFPNDPSFKKIFRVNKLMDDANHQTFEKDGTKITVQKYFEIEKKYKLKYPNLPVLWVGPTQKTIYVPMEFCRILPDQVYKGPIEPSETRIMVQKSTTNARDRKKNVQTVFNKVDINKHPLMREFGLKVSNEMERVPARVLDPPRLKTSRNIKVDRGVWKIQDFLNPVSLNKWCILNLDKYLQKQSIENLQNMIKNKGNDYNMKIADPTKSTINGESSFIGLKRTFSQLKDMQMVFVIIPDAKAVYSRVKAICETQDGILTQCVKSRTVSQDPRKLTTTVQNILLKVNAKLGGKNHCLDQSSTPPCLNGYVMVVGADVTHSSPGMTIPSVAAVTVSCEPTAFQYSTTTRVQPKGEMIKDLEDIMSKHVREFYEIRKKYPEKIIFFRDGVSEGELQKVFNEELSALRKACSNFCRPKITFIIVQKRHHTRFYATSEADETDKNYNVPVGTCVDSEIVHPRDLNFYLLSHASLLGTARPTKYRLLHDDNKLTDDEIERLSYYLCHLFSRCNRSVSYPAPTYNAHLAAARVRAYLEGLNLVLTKDQDVSSIQRQMTDKISNISPMFFV